MAEETKEPKKEKASEGKSSSGILIWAIMAVIVVICTGSGLLLGRLFAKPDTSAAKEVDANAAEASAAAEAPNKDEPASAKLSDNPSADSWYYELDPVVANLNEPGATRYVRASLILEVSGQVDQKQTTEIFNAKKPVLANWLTIYMASLSLDEIRGDKNLKRIQSQVLDSFNEKLFSDSQPMIKSVLFKEFAIQ